MSGVNICGDEGVFIPTKASEGCECGTTVVEAGENVTVNKSGDGYTTRYTVNGKDTVVTAGENINIESSVENGITTYKLSTPEIGLYDEEGKAVYTVTTDGKNYTLKYGDKVIFHVNIAADMVVDSGDTITADGTEKKGTSEDSESAGLTKGKLYVRLHIANADSTKDYVYILASDLGVVYTAGTNVSIKDGTISAKDTVTTINSTKSSQFTVAAKSQQLVELAVPTGAKFINMRCDSPYVMATNGWISGGKAHANVVNWGDSSVTVNSIECIYSIATTTGG